MFDHSQPCRASESVDLPINTTTLANGQHTLKVAGRRMPPATRAVAYDGTISTQQPSNNSLGALPGPGTSASASLARGLGQPNGIAASEGARMRLGQRSPVDAQLRQARAATLRPLGEHARPADRRRDARPVAADRRVARPQVDRSREDERYRDVRGEHAGWTVADDRGRIPGVLHATAPTQRRAGSSSRSQAGIQLDISPRRTSSEGAITLTGRVLGPVPPQGVSVDLLVHYRGHWEPFRTPRTDAAGRFTVVYQFEGARGRFPVPRGSPSKPGRLFLRPRIERGGRCSHQLALSPGVSPAAL